ncbi:hypothetical protein H0H92_011598 [Tricholoma furcatifolium]|nr:hypothetical protein H0H92_011598 [Tricholoma furcatifolium]
MFSLLLLAQAGLSFGALYETIDSLPTTTYDFIVAGGGTAGNVIANRLSENPTWRVLVVEKGPSPASLVLLPRHEGVLQSDVPLFAGSLMGSPYDWNYTTTPQSNNMYYTRGPASDFDRYANETGDPGWSWENLQPYIRKNEAWTTPADGHDPKGQFDPSVHGLHGVTSVTLAGHPQSVDSRIIQTTKELPDEFPYNEDMNSGNPLGVGWLQSTIKSGRRDSSATSYLAPDILDRPNLDVVVGTQVTRVLKTNSFNGRPVFGAVEVAHNSFGTKRLIASKEVILSLGAIGTPHVLLNSGIGDEFELKSLGVDPVLNLPDVGKNFSDQPAVWNTWRVDDVNTLDDIQRDAALREQYLREWEVNKTGPLVLPVATHLIYGRVPADSPVFQNVLDPSSGASAPHWEIFTVNGAFPITPPEGHYISLISVTVSPSSRGSVSLKSSNPLDVPLIDPATLDTDFDRFSLREAFKASSRFLSASVWKDYIVESVGVLRDDSSDEELDQHIRQSAVVALHGVGTAAMSAYNASYGVVDPDLRVKGAIGLRIIDASVFPHIPAAHTQAPVYIFAERAADLIKESWSTTEFSFFEQIDAWYANGRGLLDVVGNVSQGLLGRWV